MTKSAVFRNALLAVGILAFLTADISDAKSPIVRWSKLRGENGKEGRRLRRNHQHRELVHENCGDEDCYVMINDDWGESEGSENCIAPRGVDDGDKLYLSECNYPDDAWRVDGQGRFHSYLDDDVCIQAGHDGAAVVDGTKLRMYRCDEKEKRQKFEWAAYVIPVEYPDLCVVYQGSTRDTNDDELILKECEAVDHQRKNWSGGRA